MTKTYYLSASGIKVESYSGESLKQTTFYNWSNIYVTDIYHESKQILLMVSGAGRVPVLTITSDDTISGYEDFVTSFDTICADILSKASNIDTNTTITLPLRYFSIELEQKVDLGTEEQGVRLYSIFVIGSGNATGFIQLWSQDTVPVIKATYPISSDGNIPVNFGDGVDFETGLTVTYSSAINTLEGTDIKYLFNIAYDLI